MIQTKEEIVYGDRDEKTGKIKLEIIPLRCTKEGNLYLVADWDITSNDSSPVKSKEVFKTNDEINQLYTYILANYASELEGLNKTDTEWKLLKIALMLDTQTNLLSNGKTIYGLNPEDWEYSV